MLDVRSTLNGFGIVDVEGLYDPDDIDKINAALDPHFADLASQPRSYAHPADLMRLGLTDLILSDRLVTALFELIPDPIFHHFHVYEIEAEKSEPHIEENLLDGWHRDFDSSYTEASPSHVSLFVHLTDVGPEDGAFEFVPDLPRGKFRNNIKAIRKCGGIGHAFFWNRHYFHRASPNRGLIRRRVLKLSFQKSSFSTGLLPGRHFHDMAAMMKRRDSARKGLFGGYASEDYPEIKLGGAGLTYSRPATNIEIRLSPLVMMKARAREAYEAVRPRQLLPQKAANHD